MQGQTVVCLGGGGFVGRALCNRLIAEGVSQVRSIDVSFPEEEAIGPGADRAIDKRIVRLKIDIAAPNARSALTEAFKGASVVFHLASAGMSGRYMLHKSLCENVNEGGTRAVVDACYDARVQRLVYTSTYNVVFGNQPIADGDESLPYFSGYETDHYARTKRAAEKMVLECGQSRAREPSRSGGEMGGKRSQRVPAASSSSCSCGMCVCSLRPAAIYGDGEDRHFPRMAFMMRIGLFMFVIGGADVKVDWLHVDNLVEAQILAACALSSGVACGQTYFIADGEPCNNFEFLRPVSDALCVPFPKLRVPTNVALCLATVFEALYHFLGVPPLLTRAEVLKVGMTHYFSMEKARQELGYVPRVSGKHAMPAAAAAVVRRAARTANTPVETPAFSSWAVPVAFVAVLAAMSMGWSLGHSTFRDCTGSYTIMAICAGVVLHAFLSVWAGIVAMGRGRSRGIVLGWMAQTLVLGAPSLQLLLDQPK